MTRRAPKPAPHFDAKPPRRAADDALLDEIRVIYVPPAREDPKTREALVALLARMLSTGGGR